MRPSCYNCTRKHLSQAHILIMESLMGYPEHKWLAIGHLAEASDEIYQKDKGLANEIRKHRKQFEEDGDYEIPIMTLIIMVSSLEVSNELIKNSTRIKSSEQTS